MQTQTEVFLQKELRRRRQNLEAVLQKSPEEQYLHSLLSEVDAALERIDRGVFGLCEVCHDPIEADRLCSNPLLRFCMDHLTPGERRALEEDLRMAAQIQRELLPRQEALIDGWQSSYFYQPLGMVSGDYCDLVRAGEGVTYFILGDVSGKGVAASLLMTSLHAMFRTLISAGFPLEQIMVRASRTFCETTLPSHFATLVCVRSCPSGEMEICNAGHPAPLLVRGGQIELIGGSNLPLGLFCNEEFAVSRLKLEAQESLLLYSDGVSEAVNGEGEEYGVDRLGSRLLEMNHLGPQALIDGIVQDLQDFLGPASRTDDISMMAVRRVK